MIHYFGTHLDSKGHGFSICENDYLGQSQIRYNDFANDFFCPESIADDKKGKKLGDVFYFRIKDYTIIYIEGSCSDTRGGSKSVFFTDEKILFGEFALKVTATPICRKIINQMPFEVNWKLIQEVIDQININLKEK